MTKDDILAGQSAWQSTGGMEVGSVLGHGAYQAPDWTADWLHRELVAWLDFTAQDRYGKKYEELDVAQQATLRTELADEYRNKGRVKEDGTVVISDTRKKSHRLRRPLLHHPVRQRRFDEADPRQLRDEGQHPAQRRSA